MDTVIALRPATGWRLLAETAHRHRRDLVRLLLWSLLEAGPTLVSGALVAAALDRGFLAGDLATGLLLLCGYAATVVLGGLGARQAVLPLAGIVESLRYDLVERTVRATLARGVVPGESVDGRSVEGVTKHTEVLRMLLSQLLTVLRTAVFSLVFVIAGLFWLAPPVAWVSVAATVVVIVVLATTASGWQSRVREALLAEERLSGTASATLLGLRDVVAVGAAERATADLTADIDHHARAVNRVGRVVAGRVAVLALGARLPLVALLLTAPAAVSSGVLTPGELLGAATYLVGSLDPALRAIVRVVGDIGLQIGVLLARIQEYARPPAHPEPAPTATTTGGRLVLRDVEFAYGASAEKILDGVDLAIAAGERLVIVGPSGAGKSTMANLLAGLDRPSRGTVTLDGVPVADLDRTWPHRAITLLPQEAYVFSGSVRENLAYLNPGVTDAELARACAAVGADELVEARGGLDGRIDAPNELSEGQKQLVTLVRAYVSPSRVVVLDEATCHLHPERERRAEDAFAATGRTVVIIAHRMSSAMRADRVVLLHAGSPDVGTHQELRSTSPLYADLVGYWHES
ncbi:ABC transporter ATP-binding protein [Actinokineospora auranticolor]|uniref:ATP-binding cassette subfamily C protein n=1 Tax=Actinokineospora auranticolor TaxID=155976 RepID=A0A2S6H1E9_9PSEU|nr:ABC transporter ATP-binding protein [Actinokineospora auranticolor]PPK71305.1 ATP-binding cassette subfamily C protein [Actinokineospora auranticolor]